MLSEKKILKRITQELIRNKGWKIIVRGNAWLCPYCGLVGARNLSMSEEIEGKIAAHLLEECEHWNEFEGRGLPVEELRRKAKLVVFKVKVVRWILDDRRYSMGTDDGRWLCPFCGVITEVQLPDGDPRDPEVYGDSPDESPFLTEVAHHFLRCPEFERNDLKSQQQLDELKAKKDRRQRFDQVRERFQREPEWQLLDPERHWVCPFCAGPTEVIFGEAGPDEEFFAGLGEHLLVCKSYKKLRGKPQPVSYLKDKLARIAKDRKLEAIRRKIGSHPVWRLRDLERHWYCPYCADRTSTQYPEQGQRSGKAFDDFTQSVLDHLRRCRSYKQRKATIRSKEEMLKVIQASNLKIKQRKQLRKSLERDPRFLVATGDRAWVCPYCVTAQDEIELDPESFEVGNSELFLGLSEQLFEHFGSCRGYRSEPPSASIEELQVEAQQASTEVTNNQLLGVTAISTEWAKLKTEIEHLEADGESDSTQGRLAGFKTARATQQRLQPRLPSIPGYELASLFIECETVGGDFYDVFPVKDGLWGLTVGGVTTSGMQATLAMSLAKKLLQVHGRQLRPCQETLTLVNRDILGDLDEGTTVPTLYAVINAGTRAFQYASAGGEPILVYNERRKPRLTAFDPGGVALGKEASPGFEGGLEQRGMQLAPGDLVLAYTHGLVSASSARGEAFGVKRLGEILIEHGQQEAEYVLWRIRKAIRRWVGQGKPAADATAIALKVK